MENSFSRSLLSSVASDLTPVTADLTEVVFDSLLDEGFIKDIPFVNTIISLIKTGANIRERIFAKKLLKFLFELTSIPQKKRIEFTNQLEQDAEFRNTAGEKVLTILDKLDDSDKAAMIGKLSKACIQQRFDFNTFLRLSYIINSSLMLDLQSLAASFIPDTHTYRLSKDIGGKLYRVGLATTKIVTDIQSNLRYKRTTGNDKVDLDYTMEYKLNADAYAIAKEVFGIKWIEYGSDILF